jgi:hypothetical protein
LIGLPIINPEVDDNERGETMTLSFTVGVFREMTRREFYRVALRAILATGHCTPAHEERLIVQLRRVEDACR